LLPATDKPRAAFETDQPMPSGDLRRLLTRSAWILADEGHESGLAGQLTARGRDPENFPISKRIFMAVDDNPAVARRELDRWFTDVYHNPPGTDASGIHGTPEQVRERLEEVVAMGANHLMLNPVSNYVEQVDALAQVVGLK